jgi:soluble lytic murein transglycosylase-like protein
VESSGNPKAVNKKETALGIYQIRPAYFQDSKVKGNHSQVFDPVFARSVCEAYFKKYEKKALDNGDFETLARCHNGGCGWRKNKSATDKYWQKIKKNL